MAETSRSVRSICQSLAIRAPARHEEMAMLASRWNSRFGRPFLLPGTAHLGLQLVLRLIEIRQRPSNCVSSDKARHLAWFVSWHEADQTAFVRHLDEFAL